MLFESCGKKRLDPSQRIRCAWKAIGFISAPIMDTAEADGLNIPGVFSGTIINPENIGKASDELATK